MKPILTIGITSYKRVKELIRCIKSVKTKYVNEVEILVSEDKSPLSAEIEEAVNKLSKESKYHIRFTTNEVNLGYDMNLGAIIQKATGKYIFFMSDDDAVADNCLDKIIPVLKKINRIGVIYAPFIHTDTNKKDRNRSNKNCRILPGESSASKCIYDAILFSGLIFRKEYVINFDSARFKNLNYFQVYLFLQMMYKYGGYFFAKPSVLCIGDGENAYGLSESSEADMSQATKKRNAILANRESVKSNLEFNKTLIKVVRMFDADEGTHVLNAFAKQYSLHSISGLTIARREGKQYFKEYYQILKGLDIHLYPIIKCYYILLYVFGADKTTKLLSGFRKMVKKENKSAENMCRYCNVSTRAR